MNRYRREAMAMKAIFPLERFHFWDFVRLFTGNTASDLLHAVSDRVLLEQFTSIVSFRFAQFWGTYRGYASRAPLSDSLRQRFYYPNSWQPRKDQPTLGEMKHPIDYCALGNGKP
jgi:hypothetical protein